MLQKEPGDRLDIKEVKAHRWLAENVPIRETITQDVARILLPEINVEQPEIQKGYLVINDGKKDETPEIEEKVEEIPSKEVPVASIKSIKNDSIPQLPRTKSKEIKMNLAPLDFNKLAEVRNSCFSPVINASPSLPIKQPSTPLTARALYSPLSADRSDIPNQSFNQKFVRDSVKQVLEQVHLSPLSADRLDIPYQSFNQKFVREGVQQVLEQVHLSPLSADRLDIPYQSFNQKYVRDSVQKVLEQVQLTKQKSEMNKYEIDKNEISIDEAGARLSKLMQAQQAKLAILQKLTTNEKALQAQISEHDNKINSFHLFNNQAELGIKINSKRSKLMELSSKIKMKQKYLDSIHSKIYSDTCILAQKERTIQILQHQREKVRKSFKNAQGESQRIISELEINVDVMKSRLNNAEKSSNSDDESKLISTILKTIQEKISSIRGLADTEIAGRIESIREMAIDKEQKLTELVLNYEDIKSKITMKHRKERESMIQDIKERITMSSRNTRANIDLVRKELQDELAFLIEEEQKYTVDFNLLQERRNVCKETKLELDAFENEVGNIKKHMIVLKEKLSNLQKRKDEKQNEVDTIKACIVTKASTRLRTRR